MTNVDAKSTVFFIQHTLPDGSWGSDETYSDLTDARVMKYKLNQRFQSVRWRIVRRETFVKETVVEESK